MVRDHARRLSNFILGVVLKDKTLAKIFEEVEMRDEVVGGLAQESQESSSPLHLF